MASRWAAFKSHWIQGGKDLTIFQGLAAIKRIHAEAVSAQNAAAGWARCGFRAGELAQRAVVLEERYTEIFSSQKAGPGNIGQQQTATSNVLGVLQSVSPSKVRCSNEDCKQKVTVADRFCSLCGTPNSKFDQKTYDLFHARRRSGWHKPADYVELQPETPAEQDLAKGIGDLLARIRRSSTASDEKKKELPPKQSGEPVAEVEEPKGKKQKTSVVAEPAGATLQPQEWDLDREEDCADWICQIWKEDKRPQIRPLADFFIQELKKKSAKGEKLSETFYKTVIGPKLLCTSKRREDRVATQKHNRSLRYVPHPSSVWSK